MLGVSWLMRVLTGVVAVFPERIQRFVLGNGDPNSSGKGVVWVVIALLGGLTTATAAYTIGAEIELQTSSGPFIQTSITLLTHPYTFVLIVLIAGRSVLTQRDRIRSEKAAALTNVSAKSVLRLAKEVQSKDGVSRAVIDPERGVEDAERRIRDQLDGAADDVMKLEPRGKTDENRHDRDDAVPKPALDEEEAVTNDDEKEELTAAERAKLWYMDTAAVIDPVDILRQSVVPAIVLPVAVIVGLGIWLNPIVYAAVFAAGGVLAGVNLWRVRRSRAKQLRKLRSDSTPAALSQVSVLLKRVETREMTVYVGWVGGTRYASTDREEFVSGVAVRAIEWADDGNVTPSIMTRYADELESFRPDLPAYRDFEQSRVAQLLVDEMKDSRTVPRGLLIETVVEEGLNNTTNPATERGHDPEIVLDMYELLTPGVFAEEIETITDSDGTERDVTAVRLRGDPKDTNVEAKFSSSFNNYTGGSRYGQPAVKAPDEPEITVQPVQPGFESVPDSWVADD